VPSVLNLSRRKAEFENLCSKLSELFLESTDPTTLGNCVRALVFLAKGDHSRSDEAAVVLKNLATKLRDRLQELMEQRSKLAKKDEVADVDSDEEDEAPTAADLASAIHMCLRRLCTLAKRWPMSDLLGGDESDEGLEFISESVTAYLTQELTARQLIYHRPETQGETQGVEVPKIWEEHHDESVHVDVAGSVSEGLQLLLGLTAWRIRDEVEEMDEEEQDYNEDQIQNHILVRLRNRIRNIIVLCYEHYVEEANKVEDLADSIWDFSSAVQEVALRAAGDIRTLILKKWSKAESGLLRALAFEDDRVLVGAGTRFVKSQDDRVRSAGFISDPLCR